MKRTKSRCSFATDHDLVDIPFQKGEKTIMKRVNQHYSVPSLRLSHVFVPMPQLLKDESAQLYALFHGKSELQEALHCEKVGVPLPCEPPNGQPLPGT